tara:strand:+ start:2201 stop:2374 length:174 start_codon:yes stop_codon:yes gene_type:complete
MYIILILVKNIKSIIQYIWSRNKWIETWFNWKRLHSALGLKSIEEFEQQIKNQKLAA